MSHDILQEARKEGEDLSLAMGNFWKYFHAKETEVKDLNSFEFLNVVKFWTQKVRYLLLKF